MPYSPETQYRGDLSLLRGGQQFSGNLWSTLGALFQKNEQDKELQRQNSKESSLLRGLLKIHDPQNKDMYDSWSLDALREGAAGVGEQYNQQKAQQTQAQVAAQNALTQQHTDYYRQLTQANQALQNFARDLAAGPQQFNLSASAEAPARQATPNLSAIGMGYNQPPAYALSLGAASPSGPTVEDLSQFNMSTPAGPAPTADVLQRYQTARSPLDNLGYALAQNPEALASPQFDNSIQALQRAREATAPNLVPQSTKIGGQTVVYNPKGGNFQILPSALPAEGLQAVDVLDADGNPTGQKVIAGPRGPQLLRTENPTQAKRMEVQNAAQIDKALKEIDEDITGYNNAVERAKTDKGKPAPDRSVLLELIARRQRLLNAMGEGSGTTQRVPGVRQYLGNGKFSNP